MRRLAWWSGDRRGGVVNPEEAGGSVGCRISRASGSEQGWRNSVGAHGRSAGERQRAAAENGRKRQRRGLTTTGPGRSHWAPADG